MGAAGRTGSTLRRQESHGCSVAHGPFGSLGLLGPLPLSERNCRVRGWHPCQGGQQCQEGAWRTVGQSERRFLELDAAGRGNRRGPLPRRWHPWHGWPPWQGCQPRTRRSRSLMGRGPRRPREPKEPSATLHPRLSWRRRVLPVRPTAPVQAEGEGRGVSVERGAAPCWPGFDSQSRTCGFAGPRRSKGAKVGASLVNDFGKKCAATVAVGRELP